MALQAMPAYSNRYSNATQLLVILTRGRGRIGTQSGGY